jgi:hypothetical protein
LGLRNQQPSVIHGTFVQIARVSLKIYKERAEKSHQEKEIRDIVQVLNGLTANIIDDNQKIQTMFNLKEMIHPMMFFEGSSGTGKTQTAFTVMHHYGYKGVFYCLFNPPSDESQDIYTNFRNISVLFSRCYTMDYQNFRKPKSPTREELYFS